MPIWVQNNRSTSPGRVGWGQEYWGISGFELGDESIEVGHLETETGGGGRLMGLGLRVDLEGEAGGFVAVVFGTITVAVLGEAEAKGLVKLN